MAWGSIPPGLRKGRLFFRCGTSARFLKKIIQKSLSTQNLKVKGKRKPNYKIAKLDNLSSPIVNRKWFFISFSVEKERSHCAVETAIVIAIFISLTRLGNASEIINFIIIKMWCQNVRD